MQNVLEAIQPKTVSEVPELVDDPNAFYWIHRQIGTKKYYLYQMPKTQVPLVHSGELFGPFTRRSLKDFLNSKGIFNSK